MNRIPPLHPVTPPQRQPTPSLRGGSYRGTTSLGTIAAVPQGKRVNLGHPSTGTALQLLGLTISPSFTTSTVGTTLYFNVKIGGRVIDTIALPLSTSPNWIPARASYNPAFTIYDGYDLELELVDDVNQGVTFTVNLNLAYL